MKASSYISKTLLTVISCLVSAWDILEDDWASIPTLQVVEYQQIDCESLMIHFTNDWDILPKLKLAKLMRLYMWKELETVYKAFNDDLVLWLRQIKQTWLSLSWLQLTPRSLSSPAIYSLISCWKPLWERERKKWTQRESFFRWIPHWRGRSKCLGEWIKFSR